VIKLVISGCNEQVKNKLPD
jgi:hypothetical protein